MKYRVVLTLRAERDRDEAFLWYSNHYSSSFAARWYDGLTQAIHGLEKGPLRYARAREDDKFPFELREMLFGKRRQKHRVLFTMHDDVIAVLHIRHSARRDLEVGDL